MGFQCHIWIIVAREVSGGSHREIFLVGGKWSVRPSELEKSAAKGEV